MIELAGYEVRVYLGKMKRIGFAILALCLVSASCEKKADRMMVSETRVKTTKDRSPKLFATSDERFRDTKPSPVQGDAPENWLALPAKQFRELNYRFGESGLGEVYVSITGGSILENVNRWLQQFGAEAMSAEDLIAAEKVTMAGAEGVWVESSGTYGAGMGGGGEKPGYGLAGVIAVVDGKLVTLKMVGPEAEVAAEKEALKAFARSMKLAQ
ncbi:MAG: hypothetical protein ABJQ29_06065 [Luteolibacter sp.]